MKHYFCHGFTYLGLCFVLWSAAIFPANAQRIIQRGTLHAASLDSLIHGSPANFHAVFSQDDGSACGPLGIRPMHVSVVVARGDEALTAMLLQGASINVRDSLGRTPAHFAALARRSELLDYLVWRGADFDVVDSLGFEPLAYAAAAADTAGLRTISRLARPTANSWKQAFLSFAGKGRGTVGRTLEILSGSNFDTARWYKLAGEGREATLQELLRHTAINIDDANSGETPLHYAAAAGDAELVKLLIENHADRTRRDQKGRTPFDIAAEHFREDIKLLLR